MRAAGLLPGATVTAPASRIGRKECFLDPIGAFWHLLNFFAPAVCVGALAAGLSKLLWRRALQAVSWLRLAIWATGASALALLGGLLVFGRDGRMTTYAAMLLLCALALWWAGFGAHRR